MANQRYDYARDMRSLRAAGKFFQGAPFKSSEESLADYFRRVVAPLPDRRGLVFAPRGAGLDLRDRGQGMALWQAAQETI